MLNIEKNTIVDLSSTEIEFAHLIAKLRNASSRKQNIKDMKQDKSRTSLEIDQDGAEAEVVFYKSVGRYPEYLFNISPKSKASGTDSGDAFIDGYAFDVKTTKYVTGKLIQSGSVKETAVDIYCLIIKEGSQHLQHRYRIAGFYPAKMLVCPERYGNHFPGRPCYVATQSELLSYNDCLKNISLSQKKELTQISE
jgi:hypothetical protein